MDSGRETPAPSLRLSPRAYRLVVWIPRAHQLERSFDKRLAPLAKNYCRASAPLAVVRVEQSLDSDFEDFYNRAMQPVIIRQRQSLLRAAE